MPLIFKDIDINLITNKIKLTQVQKTIILFKDLLGFGRGHVRTKLAKKNITASFAIKGLTILMGLVLVPLTINYLDPTKYGVWITISSVVGWFGFFNIGLGHGLRYRFAEAKALNKLELAKTYVSTTYAIIGIIAGGALLIFYIINPFLNWNSLLNVQESLVLNKELSTLAIIVFTFFFARFVIKIFVTILYADQRPAIGTFINFIGVFLGLVVIYILTETTRPSLIYLGLGLMGSKLIVLLFFNLFFFNNRYKPYRPSFSSIDFSKAKELFNLGIKYFAIQISAILLFGTNNIIISHLFGPENVTPYNIAFKYFNVLMIGFTIIISPFWSAFTEAWVKKEIEWVKNIVKKLKKIWLLVFIGGLFMLALSNWLYGIWIGDKVEISFSISALVFLWIILKIWIIIYSHFFNGIAKIKLQLRLTIISSLIHVPLAIILGKAIGIEGVLISNILLAMVATVIYPIQFKKLINNKASGVWNS